MNVGVDILVAHKAYIGISQSGNDFDHQHMI